MNRKILNGNEVGITLIALIVTIIILLVLAGVTISMVTGDEGVLEKANEATEESEIAKVEEKEKLETTIDVIDDYTITLAEKLQKKYTLNYYDDIKTADEIIKSDKIGENQSSKPKDAPVAVYSDEKDNANIVLIKDTTVSEDLILKENSILNLGGKTLTLKDGAYIDISSNNVIIDGTKKGSCIKGDTTIIKVNSSDCTIKGGKYEINSKGVGSQTDPNVNIIVSEIGKLNIDKATIISKDTEKNIENGTLYGISVKTGGLVTISNSNIEVYSPKGLESMGINNNGTMIISDSNIKAYSNYTAQGSSYTSSSKGITSNGKLILNNCYVYGTHSGVASKGPIYIDGGIYEGYGHGGIYFSGGSTTSYVRGAIIRKAEMPNGYIADDVAGTNNAGFYIGVASDINIYMDECDIYGYYYPIVFRNSGGEKRNCLYMSNSKLEKDEANGRGIRIRDNTHKFYNGIGNENLIVYESNTYSGLVEDTNESYKETIETAINEAKNNIV